MGESRAVLLLADGQSDLIAALITMGVAILIALAVDRLVIARGTRVASRMADTTLSRTTRTRLRLIRRLVFVIILAIGAALALSRFHQFSRLATGIPMDWFSFSTSIAFLSRTTIA